MLGLKQLAVCTLSQQPEFTLDRWLWRLKHNPSNGMVYKAGNCVAKAESRGHFTMGAEG